MPHPPQDVFKENSGLRRCAHAKHRFRRLGEQLTAEYLEEKGYEIVERNFKCRFGEIDVIAQNDRYLAFVEVKTRSADGLSHPFEAITPSKRAKVIKTAQYYLINHETNLQPRFDAAAVFTENGALVKIEYLENAFY